MLNDERKKGTVSRFEFRSQGKEQNMLLRTEGVSEKQIAANQANGKKSTGPRTDQGKRVSSQNNFKHGYYARMQPEVMAALHEDPIEKTRDHLALTNDYQPAGASQQMVIDDLADWRWHRKQVVRSWQSQMGLVVRDVDRHRQLMHLQIGQNVADVSQAEVLEKGLRNIPDSPGKYVVLIDKFNDLIKQVKDCNYSDAVPYLTAIYGKQASWRGAIIFNHFLELDRLSREREAAFKARRPWPAADDPLYKQGPVPTADQEWPNDDPRLDKPSESLLYDLNLELRDVQEAYASFVEDKITVTQINRDAAIAPTRQSLIAARELEIVDRQIAAKIRLFMEMRVKDRSWRLIQQQDEESEEQGKEEQGETAKSAGDAGSNGARPEAKQDEARDAAGGDVGSNGARPEADPAMREQTVEEEERSSAAGPEADPGPEAAPTESDPEPDVAAAVQPPSMAEPAETSEVIDEPTATSGSVGSCDRNEDADSASESEPATGGPAGGVAGSEHRVVRLDEGSTVATLPLLMVVCVLAVMLGVRARSAVGTPPLQVKAIDSRESTGAPRPRASAAQPYALTGDGFCRSEAAELLKTKDSASGPNPFRTHFANPRKAGREEAAGGEDVVPSAGPDWGP